MNKHRARKIETIASAAFARLPIPTPAADAVCQEQAADGPGVHLC